MRRNLLLGFAVLSLFASSALLGGCGSSKKEGQKDVVTTVQLQNAARLGDENCLQCHNAGQDLTMAGSGDGRTIGEAWRTGLHHESVNGIVTVHCEDCHGGGQFHWGLGPLAFPNPQANVCLKCHGNNPPAGVGADFGNYTAYLNTAHANRDNLPDKFFFQGGTGNEQAENRGVPEFVKGTRTPVTKNQHIEECSVCHNNNQRFVFGTLSSNNGNGSSFGAAGSLLRPDPENMPTPQVACASCHDAHGIGREVRVATRTEPVDYPILRKVQVDSRGANSAFGNWTSPHIFSTNGVVEASGAVTRTAQGRNNELNTELLCASCHTKGLYKYGKQQTHNEDVYPQWRTSGHGDRRAAAWAEFSANPRYYGYDALSHQTSYPYDMSAPAASGVTDGVTNPASLGQNAGNNNFACFKCHNGIASIDWQNNVQGTPQARVVWGDEPAVCITCHDPHRDSSGGGDNIRIPVAMSRYSSVPSYRTSPTTTVRLPNQRLKFNGVGTFLDRQPLPPTSNSTICIFCHQGRESGYTLFKMRIQPGDGQPLILTTNQFFNPHYLPTAAMLWGENAYEFANRAYSVNTAHQQQNCTGCHMNNATEQVEAGGHTWRPNPATCTPCHSNIKEGQDLEAILNADANAKKIQQLQTMLIQLLDANGIYYDDTQNPYFFRVKLTPAGGTHANSTVFTNWTPEALKAAFNLAYVVKGLPAEGGEAEEPLVQLRSAAGAPTGIYMPANTQTDNPNRSAAVHNYKYAIQLLIDSFNEYYAVAPDKAGLTAIPASERPAGTRNAVNYLTLQRSGPYSPLQ